MSKTSKPQPILTTRDFCGTAFIALRCYAKGGNPSLLEQARQDLRDAPSAWGTSEQRQRVWGWLDALGSGAVYVSCDAAHAIADDLKRYFDFHEESSN